LKQSLIEQNLQKQKLFQTKVRVKICLNENHLKKVVTKNVITKNGRTKVGRTKTPITKIGRTNICRTNSSASRAVLKKKIG
jgi:hypothetical protein